MTDVCLCILTEKMKENIETFLLYKTFVSTKYTLHKEHLEAVHFTIFIGCKGDNTVQESKIDKCCHLYTAET